MSAIRRTPRKPTRRAATPAKVLQSFRASALGAVNALLERGARTRKAVSRLEHVFEQRVSRAMSTLGVPSAREVRALSRQVAELQQSVERLRRARARA